MNIKHNLIIQTKSMILRFTQYKKGQSNNQCGEVMFIAKDTPVLKYPGLVDRLKAIIGTYYIAKKNDMSFSIYHTSSFLLEKYLVPNIVDWKCKKELYWTKNVRFFEYDGRKELPVLDPQNRYHCWFFTGYDILEKNNIIDWENQWGILFHELFRPSEYLANLLRRYKPNEPYIAVHIRFVNALEHFEDGYDNNLSEKQQKVLIEKCLKQLSEIHNKDARLMIIFSDSIRFLRIAESKGYKTLGTQNIGHISFSESSEVYDKTFLDFFAIANAEKLYSIKGGPLYNSVFPKYAAMVNNIEHERIYLEK